MPNWCNNTLKITGDPQQIERLPWKDINQFPMKLFQSLLPCPDGLNGQSRFEWEASHSKADCQEQYYWSVENWGVKWDCSIEIVDFSGDFIELEFDTPRRCSPQRYRSNSHHVSLIEFLFAIRRIWL